MFGTLASRTKVMEDRLMWDLRLVGTRTLEKNETESIWFG